MAIQFRLTLASETAVDQIARLAVDDPGQRSTPIEFFDQMLSVDLYQQRGFELTIRAGRDGYYEADDDGAAWTWEPTAYVNLTFSMDKDEVSDKGIPNMLEILRRVLHGTTEDAALVQDDNWLLLTRTDGTVRKHDQAEFWDHYGFANEIIPG